MSFVNSFFLFALAGAVVPVLIHYLTRDRIQHVAFSTLRFFAKGAKMVVRRKKFEELILLLLRVALLALLAIIFARPFFNSKAAQDARKEFSTARVVVLDVSGSMRRPRLLEELKKVGRGAVDSLTEGKDTAAVITFADTPVIAAPIGDSLASAKAAVDAATPGYGGTNIAEALRKADELLRGVGAKQKEIVLVSDLQRDGWSYFKGDWKLASDVKLTIYAFKPSAPGSGIGIVEMSAPSSLVLDKQPAAITVRVANFSDQPVSNLNVALTINGQKADTQQINLRPNGKVAVRFRHVFDTPGDNPGSVTVGNDPSTPDNTVYFNARTLPKIPVLVISSPLATDAKTGGTFFLDKALVPTDGSPFTAKLVTSNAVTAADVTAARVLVLNDAGPLAPDVVAAVAQRVESGGGILFLPGDQTKADVFNAAFGSISPCKLRQVLQAHPANGETAESLTRIDFDHPVLDVFGVPHHGDLTLPKFARYWETTDTQLSHVLARFGDGRPAILEREVGKGAAIALVSGVDANWNDFAQQSVFLPFIHQAVRYLAVQTGQPTTFASGDLLPVPAGDSLKDPAGKPLAPAATGSGKSGIVATFPGFYLALNPQGGQDFCYAVNGSLTETNPATVGSEEIVSAIERAPDELVGGLNDDTPSQEQKGKTDAGLWWYLVWGVLVLSMGELVLGNKTLRH